VGAGQAMASTKTPALSRFVFAALAALACLLRPGAPVELHRKLSGWSDDAGATWYGAPNGAGSDGACVGMLWIHGRAQI